MTSLGDDHIHSPSFASVIFMDGMQPADQGTEETDLLMDSHLSLPVRHPGKRYPRLELDVAMDKYHTLDDFAEPLNPQNTPASHTYSGSGSPQDTCRRIKTDSLRTSSAPQALLIDWCPPGSSLNLLENDDLKYGKAADSHPKKSLADIISSARCVRFSPPPTPSGHSPRPFQRPLPSIERNKDYISSFRQQKQFEKWRVAARAKSQRVSPYRSPKKSTLPASIQLNAQPEICFSPSKTPLHQDTDTFGTSQPQEHTETYFHPDKTITPTAYQRPLLNLVAVSLSLHHIRKAAKSSESGLRAMNLQLSYSLRPIGTRLQDEEARNVVTCATMNDLLLYVFFIVPEFVLRGPLAILHYLNRAAHTRTGLAALVVLRLFWSIILELITPVLSKLGMNAIVRSNLKAKY
ncbi:unnamed protein product [Penicillium manginii]